MSDNKEQYRVKPWEVRMQEYFAQGSVPIRTPAAFMAEEIDDWRAAQPVVLSDEQREAIRHASALLALEGYTEQSADLVAILAAKEQAK